MFTDNSPIRWDNEKLYLLDQRKLPETSVFIPYEQAKEAALAIKNMVVRGAPAIGVTAAYGTVLAARAAYARSPERWKEEIEADLRILADARPTAVNLVWALQRMRKLFPAIDGDPEPKLLAEAQRIHREDIDANRHMGKLGAALLPDDCGVLTHCNAGALATGGYGTALGVIRSAWSAGKIRTVYADETRPWLQGARLTAWELLQDKIPVTLLADSAAAALMQRGKISWVIVGSDRIAGNGDVANKIGTYSLAVLARYHGVKFMVAAPASTVDMNLADGAAIPIEDRSSAEVLNLGDRPIAANGATAWNPVFDVTPASLVDVIVTEKGVLEAPNRQKMEAMMNN
ncbi:MAG: S-methyl-5-thioribose-1-phosphate isomerase [Gammaproteobacteria bacterium]|nr:S-methyl-5-thioribose-1-phosphate isomerase [Gammaproteobacteria bacterium]